VAAAEAGGMQLRKLDRKGEKALVQETRVALAEKLEGEGEPPEVLALAVPLIMSQVEVCFLLIGGSGGGGIGGGGGLYTILAYYAYVNTVGWHKRC